MKLFENPIFITQKRLVHRAGVLALVLGILLIGLSMLVALYYHLIWDKFDNQPWRPTPTQLGYRYYAWLLVIQALVLVLGGFSRISRTLVEERKAGLLDSNRMTPLTGSQLVMGYWFGSALREFYLAAVLIPVGFGIVLMAGLPLQFWLGTQLLLFSSGLFFGLLAILAGMAMPRAQGGVGMVLLLVLVFPATAATSRFSLTNFLLPIYAAMHLFHPSGPDSVRWESAVGFYGAMVSPLIFTLILQGIFGCLAWRGAVRKFGNPHQPAFSRSEIMTVYGLLVFFQYGLVWEQRELYSDPSHLAALCALHGSILFLGVVMLTPQLLYPEKARIVAMRHGAKGDQRVLWKSGPCAAVGLAAIACAGLLTQCVYLFPYPGWRYLVASINTLVVLLTFSLLLEVCRLLFRKKAIGFFALALFVLYGLPFVLSMCFLSSTPMKFSVCAPGIAALVERDFESLRYFRVVTLVHVVMVVALASFWAVSWRQWLARATA